MIKINTLTKEQIDNIPIMDIELDSRILNGIVNANNREHIDNREIVTLLDLKNFVLEYNTALLKVPNLGRKSFRTIIKLLEHAYPNTSFNKNCRYTKPKYTFD